MTSIQEQKLQKFLAFREYLSQYPQIIEEHPHLKSFYELFIKQIDTILKTCEIMEENLKVSDSFHTTKDELIRLVVFISRKVTAYAQLEEMTDVQGIFCCTYEELAQESNPKLLKTCQNLLFFISNHKVELIDYDIDLTIENKLRNSTGQFSLLVENDSINKEVMAQSENQLIHLVNDADEILEKALFPLKEHVLTQLPGL